ncbi:hypothetical protein [Luteimonas suaedae]|uniref:hypothetical protein n=1 Tax=Luteimonas suaedae TaxID=2605430 RepID=UPI0011F020A0|nr:hypothetical protein [Luteimonas suaedae]
MAMRRATLAAEPDDQIILDAWLDRWETRLVHLSDNLGCGCCIDMFDVEAPDEALAELPERLFASGERTVPGGSRTGTT